MGDCGIPGCKYNKLTPDKNKSFKCDYWKIASRKKNEAISLTLSKNNDLQVKALKGDLSFRKILRELPYSDSDQLDLFNSSINENQTQDSKQQVDQNQPDDSVPANKTSDLAQPKLTGIDNQSVDKMVKELSVPHLFDQNAQIALQKVVNVIKTVIPSLVTNVDKNSNNIQNSSDNHETVVSKTDASTIILWNEVQNNRSKVNELEKRVRELENQVNNKTSDEWLYLPENTSIKDIHITYSQLLLYSKHVRRVFNTDDPGRPCFVVTKNKAIIKYLVKMYPAVFWFYQDFDYKEGDTPNSLDNHNSRKYTDINIVPDFNFISKENLSSNHVVCFRNETYQFKPNWFPSYAEYDDGPYFDVKIMDYFNHPSFNYKFMIYDEIQNKVDSNLSRLTKWIKRFSVNEEEFNNKFCYYDKIEPIDLK